MQKGPLLQRHRKIITPGSHKG